MPLLNDLLEGASVGIPRSIGDSYNKLNRTGSWVVNGVEDYLKWVDNDFEKVRHYFNAYFNFDRDPTKAAWMLDMLTRENPVQPPPNMGEGEWNLLKIIWNKFLGKDSKIDRNYHFTPRDETYKFKTNIHRPSQDERFGNTHNIINHNTMYSSGPYEPYEDQITAFGSRGDTTRLLDINSSVGFEKLSGLRTGYRNWYGFEPGSDHQWSIQLYPYNGPSWSNKPGAELPTKSNPGGKFHTLTPELPTYKLPEIFFSNQGYSYEDGGQSTDKGINENLVKQGNKLYRLFNYGTELPCISYDFQLGTSSNTEIQLFNKMTIGIPTGFDYQYKLGIEVIDDREGNFRKYMNNYFNIIYDDKNAALARYDQCAFLIRLVILESEQRVKWEYRLVGVPIDYTSTLSGGSDSDLTTVHVDFSIVGCVKPLSNISLGEMSYEGPDDRGTLKDTTWTDVMIIPSTKSK